MHKSLKLIIGVVLIIIGAGALLRFADINIITFNGFFRTLRLIWPLLLVVIGIYFITDSKPARYMAITLFAIALIGGTIYNSMTVDRNIFDNGGGHENGVFDRDDDFGGYDFFDF